VWTKAPFFFRNELVAVEGMDQQRPAGPDEVKRLGDHPLVVRLTLGSATVEVAAKDDDAAQLSGPYSEPIDAAAPTPVGQDVAPS
jgi:hypothetical protein